MSCPSGWTRVSAWDGKFLRGYASYGGTGGLDTHSHTLDLPDTQTSIGASDWGSISGSSPQTNTNGTLKTHTHMINPDSLSTATSSNEPTYIAVVYCAREDS